MAAVIILQKTCIFEMSFVSLFVALKFYLYSFAIIKILIFLWDIKRQSLLF